MNWIAEVEVHSNPPKRTAFVVAACSRAELVEIVNSLGPVWHEVVAAQEVGFQPIALDRIAGFVSKPETLGR